MTEVPNEGMCTGPNDPIYTGPIDAMDDAKFIYFGRGVCLL